MAEKNMTNLIDNAMKNLKTLVDSNTVIGQPIKVEEGITIIPVTKINFGFGSGGGDLPSSQKEMFGGGTGGGVSIQPVAFLVIEKGTVKMLKLETYKDSTDRIVGLIPDVMDRVTGFVDNHTAKKAAPAETVKAPAEEVKPCEEE